MKRSPVQNKNPMHINSTVDEIDTDDESETSNDVMRTNNHVDFGAAMNHDFDESSSLLIDTDDDEEDEFDHEYEVDYEDEFEDTEFFDRKGFVFDHLHLQQQHQHQIDDSYFHNRFLKPTKNRNNSSRHSPHDDLFMYDEKFLSDSSECEDQNNEDDVERYRTTTRTASQQLNSGSVSNGGRMSSGASSNKTAGMSNSMNTLIQSAIFMEETSDFTDMFAPHSNLSAMTGASSIMTNNNNDHNNEWPSSSLYNGMTDSLTTSSSITTVTTTSSNGGSHNASSSSSTMVKKKKRSKFVFNVIIPCVIWKSLDQVSYHHSMHTHSPSPSSPQTDRYLFAVYVNIYDSCSNPSTVSTTYDGGAHQDTGSSYILHRKKIIQMRRPDPKGFPDIWRCEAKLPFRSEFQYSYSIKSSPHDHAELGESHNSQFSVMSLTSTMIDISSFRSDFVVEEGRKRSCAPEKYDIFVVDRDTKKRLRLSSSNPLRLLQLSNQPLEPLRLYLEFLLKEWSKQNDSSIFSNCSISDFLTSNFYLVWGRRWTKDLSKYELDDVAAFPIVKEAIVSFVRSVRLSFLDSVVICCIIGQLPRKQQSLSTDMIYSIIRGLASKEGHQYSASNKLEDQLADVRHMSWFQTGLSFLFESTKELVDAFILLGCAPYVSDTRVAISAHLLEQYEEAEIERAFNEAVQWLREFGGLAMECRGLWSYCLVLSELILHAPTYLVLKTFLCSELDQDQTLQITEIACSAFMNKLKMSRREKTNEEIRYIADIVQCHAAFQNQNVVIELLRSGSLANVDPMKIVEIIGYCDTSAKDQSYRQDHAFNIIHNWCLEVFKRRNILFTSFRDFVNFIGRMIESKFFKGHEMVLLDDAILSFIDKEDRDLITSIAGVFRDTDGHLRSFLLDMARRVIRRGMKDTSDLEQLLKAVNNMGDAYLKDKLLDQIVKESNIDISYESLLTDRKWYLFLRDIKMTSLISDELKQIFELAHDRCRELVALVSSGRIQLKIVKLLISDPTSTFELLRESGMTEDKLSRLKSDVDRFYHRLNTVQSYLMMFENDRIALVNRIIDVRKNMLDSTLSDLMNFVDTRVEITDEDLDWFYELRRSELFLNLWNEVRTSIKFTTDSKMMENIRWKWSNTFHLLDQSQIAYSDLERIVLMLTSEKFEQELLLLKKTNTEGNQGSDEDLEWCAEKSHLLSAFKQLYLYNSYSPVVKLIISHTMYNFVLDVSQSEEYKRLGETIEFNGRNSKLSQQFISDKLESIASSFSVGIDQLKFLVLLCQDTGLLDWLISYRSDNEFIGLINVCRSFTDSARHLETLSSLEIIRSVLLPIISPRTPFATMSEFQKVLRELAVDDNIVTHMKNLQRNFLKLKKVFEERTRSPGIQALYDVEEIVQRGQYIFKCTHYDHIVTCRVEGCDELKTIDTLIALRNNLMLTEVPREFKDQDIGKKISNFAQQIIDLCSIRDVLYALMNMGHFSYQSSFIQQVPSSVGSTQLNVILNQFKEDRKNWEHMAQEFRESSYFSNMFRMQHLLRLVSLLDDQQRDNTYENPCLDQLYSVLQFPDISLKKDRIVEVARLWVPTRDLLPQNILANLASFLKDLYSSVAFAYRNIPVDDKTIDCSSNNLILFQRLNQNHFCIARSTGIAELFDFVVSLYSHFSRRPAPEELLFCHDATDFEDILIIINRWFRAELNNRQDTTYAIINIHAAPYSVQRRAASYLKKLLRLLEGETDTSCSRLIIAEYVPSYMMTVLSQYVINVHPLSLQTIRRIYQTIPAHATGGLGCYSSSHPGAGKTQTILRNIYTSSKSTKYVRVSLTGQSSSDSLISQIPTDDTGSARSYHLSINASCIACLASDVINTLLFKFLYIGCLRSRRTGDLFYLKFEDGVNVEMPSSAHHLIEEKLFICQRLPKYQIQARKVDFTDEYYTLIPSKVRGLFSIKRAENFKIQYVCKRLHAFDTRTLRFNDYDESSDLPIDHCYELLSRYASRNHETTFSIMHNFVTFAYGQLKTAMKFTALKQTEIYYHVIESIVRMTRAFCSHSIRSIEQKGPPIDFFQYYCSRFNDMKTLSDCAKSLCVFLQDSSGEITGLNLTVGKKMETMDSHNISQQYGFDLEKQFTTWENEENNFKVFEFLRSVAGVFTPAPLPTNYFISSENIKKALIIILRLQYNLPVLVIGETGIGKTELFKYVASVLNLKMHRFNIHSGTKRDDIIEWLELFISNNSARNNADQTLLYFDQINLCNSMDIFKDILCDRALRGYPLPDNLKIVATCSPYRLKDINNVSSGLQQVPSRMCTTQDCMLKKLVYRVYTMPESLMLHVMQFGATKQQTVEKYIRAIMVSELDSKLMEDMNCDLRDQFVEMMYHSQEFVRQLLEESAVSLRDVKRCVRLFNWFVNHLRKRDFSLRDLPTSETTIRDSIILALGHCYYYRLNLNHRKQYCEDKPLMRHFPKFIEVLVREQEEFTKYLILPECVAMNDALRENISVIIVSILNKVPIFIVGNPGSSKSLAMEIISSNFHGKAATSSFLQSFPALEVFNFQCSQSSKEQQLEEAFEAACKHQRNVSSDTVVVLLLNEVGLLEHSPFNPLQVVNKELEEPQISVVGLSNWSLDPSTNSKVICISRPEPTISDLKNTLSAIVSSIQLGSSLYFLAKAYHEVYRCQTRKDFFGLRDFYSMVKFMIRNMHNSLSVDLLVKAVYRNFGGRPEEMSKILSIFCDCMGLDVSTVKALPTTLDMIKENLADSRARHLMLLTRNNAALSILFDQGILAHDQTEVIFGTDFIKDSDIEMHVCTAIQSIRYCMAKGRTVVLVNCEDLYESLYDLFNMQYLSYDGNRYASLVIGTHSKQCVVHEKFRVIIIAEQDHAYRELPSPLLNRFEKQVLLRQAIFEDRHFHLLNKIESWCASVCPSEDLSSTFIGFHSDMLSSLVLSICHRDFIDEQSFMNKAKSELLWIGTIDGILRAERKKEDGTYLKTYFDEQVHTSLRSFISYVLSEKGAHEGWILPGHGAFQICLTTFSSSSLDVKDILSSSTIPYLSLIHLHEFESEVDVATAVEAYFQRKDVSLLIVQCDMNLNSLKRVQYLKYICEKNRALSDSNLVKHILLITHIRPCNQDMRFSIDFDASWRYVFIDELREIQPPIDSIIRSSLSDHCDNVNLRHTVKLNFRTSISLLRYRDQEKIDHVTRRIKHVSELLNNDEFWNAVQPRLRSILLLCFSTERKNMWSHHVAQYAQKYFLLAENFYSALSFCITRMIIKAFALLLADIDRNNNLILFGENALDADMSRLWLHLFENLKVPDSSVAFGNRDRLEMQIVDVPSHGISPSFSVSFPFSYVVCRIMNKLRTVFDCSTSKSGRSNAFIQHVLALNLFNNIPGRYVYLYMRDYIQMYGTFHSQLELETQIILKMLEIAGTTSVAEAQKLYWEQERRLQSYFKIFEAFPKVVDRFLPILQLKNYGDVGEDACIENVDVLLFKVVYNEIDPLRHTHSENQKVEWLQYLSDIIAPVEDLLSQLPEDINGVSKMIKETWSKLLLFRDAMIQIVIPLGIIPEISIQLWRNIRPNDCKLGSSTALYTTLHFLTLVYKVSRNPSVANHFFETFIREYFVPSIITEEMSQADFDLLLKIVTNRIEEDQLKIIVQDDLRCAVLGKLLNSDYKRQTLAYVKKVCVNEMIQSLPVVSNDNDMVTCIFLAVNDTAILHKLVTDRDISSLMSQLTRITPSILDVSQWNSDTILKNLQVISLIRVIIAVFVDWLIVSVDDSTPLRDMSQFSSAITKLLETNSLSFLRDVALRLVAQRKGLPFLQQKFARSETVQKLLPWLGQHLIDLNLVETSVHKVLFFKLGGFASISKSFARLLRMPFNVTSRNMFEQVFDTGLRHNVNAFKKLSFLALFDQAFMSKMTPSSEPNIQNRIQLFTTFVLGNVYSHKEKDVLTSFFDGKVEEGVEFFSFNKPRSSDDVGLLYVIGHIISIAINNKEIDNGIWSILFSEHEDIISNLFLPTMNDTDIDLLFNSTRGQWYQCENGHPYLVDLCGAPMEKSFCPQCGAEIGGRDHNLPDSNSRATIERIKGYKYHDLNTYADIHSTIRGLSPVSFRLIRIIIHALLLVRYASNSVTNNEHNRATYFLDHLRRDWSVLHKIIGYNEEKMGILVFHILETYAYHAGIKYNNLRAECQNKRRPIPNSFDYLRTFNGCVLWESDFQYSVNRVLDNAELKFKSYYDDLGNNSQFIRVMNSNKQATILPLNSYESEFWSYSLPNSNQYMLFKSEFMRHKDNEQLYPLLYLFLKHEKQLYSTRYIAHVVKWQKTLCSFASRKIDQHYARTQTVRNMIDQFPSQKERRELGLIFNGFAAAFNSSMKNISHFKCQQIPKQIQELKMGLDAPLIYGIPSEENESICSLGLLEWLVQVHNNIVYRVNELMTKTLKTAKKLSKSNANIRMAKHLPSKISTKYVSQHQLIVFNKEELAREIESAITHDNNQNVRYDLERIEQFIFTRYISGKPLIDVDHEEFEFLGSQRYDISTTEFSGPVMNSPILLVSSMSHRVIELGKFIPQEEISNEMRETIVNDITNLDHNVSSQMQLCLMAVEEVISFLQVFISGAQHALQYDHGWHQMSLCSYIRDVLLVSDSNLLKSQTIRDHIKLKHLSSLWSLFESQVTSNPFSRVNNRYRKQLSEQERKQLLQLKSNCSKSDISLLATSFKNFMLEYLTDDTISAQESLKIVLAHIPVIVKKSVATSVSPMSPHPSSVTSVLNIFDTNTASALMNEREKVGTGGGGDDNSTNSWQTIEVALGNFTWFEEYFPVGLEAAKALETYHTLASEESSK